MVLKPANYRYRYPVSEQMICIIVTRWQRIIVRDSHQTGSLTRRKKPRPYAPSFYDYDCLATGTSNRRPQTSRDSIEPNFCTLNHYTVLIGPCPLVDRSDVATAGPQRIRNSLPVRRGHETEKPVRFGLGIPDDPSWAIFNQRGEGRNSPLRRWECPPNPVSHEAFRQLLIRFDQRFRMPRF